MNGVAIGEYITVRNLRPLISGAKTPNGKQYLMVALSRRIELTNLILIEIKRISARKYQIVEIVTEDNSVGLDENELTLTADWYDIKQLSAAREVKWFNALLGEQTEFRMQGDYKEEELV